MNTGLKTKRTFWFSDLSQVACFIFTRWFHIRMKNAVYYYLFNRKQDQTVNKDGCISEVASTLITTSSIWEFQPVHQTWNTQINNSLAFNIFIIPSSRFLLCFFKWYFTWLVANKSWFSKWEQLVTADCECRKAEMNCPGLSVAHQRDIGIKMSLFWRGGDQCDFEACLHLAAGDKIFLTSALGKTCVMSPVNWLEASLGGESFDITSAEIFIRLTGDCRIQTHQDSAFHSMDKKMEISVVDSY